MKHTDETKQKIKDARRKFGPGRRAKPCVVFGVSYTSITEAAKALDRALPSVMYYLKSDLHEDCYYTTRNK